MITTPLCRAPLFVSPYGWICIYLHFVLSDNMHRIQMEMTCIDLYINEAVNGCHPWPIPLEKACVVQKVTHLLEHWHCRATLGTPGPGSWVPSVVEIGTSPTAPGLEPTPLRGALKTVSHACVACGLLGHPDTQLQQCHKDKLCPTWEKAQSPSPH